MKKTDARFQDGILSFGGGWVLYIYDDIGGESVTVNLLAFRCEPAGKGNVKGTIVGKAMHVLDRAFAIGLLADEAGTTSVLKGAGDDLGGAGSATVDKDDKWPFNTAACGCIIRPLAAICLTLDNHRAAVKEITGHSDSGVE